jgi:HAE1 family hydrophobic/amphiphilic exporter-1
MTITELSIKRPSLVIIVFAALAVLGLYSYQQLQYELLPKIAPPVLTITTAYPGAAPSEVETSITKVIEDAVSGMDKVSEIHSSSMEGVSMVVVELIQSANTDFSLQDASRKIGEVTSKLPTGAKTPVISKIQMDEIPVLRMGVSSNMNNKDFAQFITDQIKPELAKVEGVGQVVDIGGEQREIQVNLDLQKLRSVGLSIAAVTNTIKAGNLDFPTGKIDDSDGQFVVRLAGKYNSIEELRKLSIGKSKEGSAIYLGDVAEVEDGVKEPTNYCRINLHSTVSLNIQKQSDANAVTVSELVRKKLADLEKKYSDKDLKFNIAQDASTFTISSADAVKEDLAIAVLLVAMVMLLFLHSFRNSLIVLVAVPSSLISTFIAMYAFDMTLNLMTLLGLSLVVGILVDDSIVVLENIYHHLEKGEDKRTAALRGRNEIGFAALAITMVDVAVFLPLALISGMIGNIMRQFSLVVVVSTLLSLFVSFTVTPMLASRFAKLEKMSSSNILGRFAIWFEQKFRGLTKQYVQVLEWSLKHWVIVMLVATGLFLGAVSLVPMGFIGTEMMAVADRGEFAVTLELPPGATLEQTNLTSHNIERMLLKVPEVKELFVNAGASSEGLLSSYTNNVSEITVILVDKKMRTKSTNDLIVEIKKMVGNIPGVKVRANPIGMFGTANSTPIQVVVSGTNIDDVNKGAKHVQDIFRNIPGTADVRLSTNDAKPETRIVVDRDKLNQYGLSISDVGSTLRIALTGDDESKFRDGSNEYDIRIHLDEYDRSNTTDLNRITFTNKKGDIVELQQFATVIRTTGPTKLQREGRIAAITVYSQAFGRPSGTITQDFEKELKKNPLPPGTKISYTGEMKSMGDSFKSLGVALIAALLFTYMIMVALYDSFIHPLVVLFSVPLAMIGGLLALALTMKALSIFTILGIIMLIGLVSKNAILLVDRTNSRRSEGESVHDALVDAAQMRLRPILMTTLTMIFGMLPIALSKASGAEWKTGLAAALIGGLTSSLLLTLVVVPIVYTKMEVVRIFVTSKVRNLLSGKKDSKEDSGVVPQVEKD